MKAVHFEISSKNPQEAANFYTKVSDWNMERWNGPQDYWFVDTGKGINRAIMYGTSGEGIVATVDVSAIDEMICKI